MTSEHVRKTGHRVEVLSNDETTPFLELPESSLISFFHAQQFFKNQSICIFFFLNSKDLKFNHTLPSDPGPSLSPSYHPTVSQWLLWGPFLKSST